MEIQKQISHKVDHLNNADSVPSVIDSHINEVTSMQSNKSKNETGVIKELRSFLDN